MNSGCEKENLVCQETNFRHQFNIQGIYPEVLIAEMHFFPDIMPNPYQMLTFEVYVVG